MLVYLVDDLFTTNKIGHRASQQPTSEYFLTTEYLDEVSS